MPARLGLPKPTAWPVALRVEMTLDRGVNTDETLPRQQQSNPLHHREAADLKRGFDVPVSAGFGHSFWLRDPRARNRTFVPQSFLCQFCPAAVHGNRAAAQDAELIRQSPAKSKYCATSTMATSPLDLR